MSSTWEPNRLIGARLISEVERGQAMAWVNTALRTRNQAIEELLAEALGRAPAKELRTRLAEEGAVGGDLRAHPLVAGALGTIWAASGASSQHLAVGQVLLKAALELDPLTKVQQQIYAQVSFLLRRLDDVERALQKLSGIAHHTAESLRTDLLNPTVTGKVSAAWIRRMNAPFRAADLASIMVRQGATTLFDGLHAPRGRAVDGPLVSVIMPCYRPDSSLNTSLSSILEQTYENLEVLLVDDGSGAAYNVLFQEAAGRDPRVRLLRLPHNGGSYLARNAALEVARGTFITTQDADDWSHPQRIADQVATLAAAPSAGGSRSDAIRATDELLHQWVGYSPRRQNASSLMFRRADLERTGPFLSVRKGGDSEFDERLTRVVGPVIDTRTPLAVTRLRIGSLSRGDFTYSWMHPDRLLYRSAYRSWHLTLPPRTRDVPALTPGDRPFPVPNSFLRGLPGQAVPPPTDLLIVLDGSDPAAVAEAEELCRNFGDRTVGVLHIEDPTRGRGKRPVPTEQLMVLAREGKVRSFSPADRPTARVCVFLSPGILELPPESLRGVTVQETVVVVRPWHASDELQDHLTEAESCRELYGRPPIWAAADETDLADLAADGWDLPVLRRILASLLGQGGPAGAPAGCTTSFP